jgi:hypothetical protein
MGQRFRLKPSFDISGFSSQVQVILRALKTYGMMLSDNGSSWYISGVPDKRWDNDALHELHQVRGSDFEAVDVSSLVFHSDSGQVGHLQRISLADVIWLLQVLSEEMPSQTLVLEDVNGDGKPGLAEAIRGLQMIAGTRAKVAPTQTLHERPAGD